MKLYLVPGLVLLNIIFLSAPLVLAGSATDYSKACKKSFESGINEGRDDVCAIGIAASDGIKVVYATDPEMAGKKFKVYETRVMEGGLRELKKISECSGRFVGIAGFRNGGAIYSAAYLGSTSDLFAAAIIDLSKIDISETRISNTKDDKFGC